MDRKSFIKNSFIFAGSLAFLPYLSSCQDSVEQANLVLAELGETIIPETTTPGSKTLGLHNFVRKMIEDCGDEEQQKLFGKGLVAFESRFKRSNDIIFENATPTQRSEFLKTIEAGELEVTDEREFEEKEIIERFYSLVKSLTIRGYKNSKYYMTEVVPYELVPGRYNPFYKIA